MNKKLFLLNEKILPHPRRVGAIHYITDPYSLLSWEKGAGG
jgi:hypothetical protein